MIKQICKLTCIALPLLLTSCIKADYDTENCWGQYTITPITPEELGQGNHVELKNTNTTLIFPDGNARQTEVGSDKVLQLYKGRHTAIPVKGTDDKVKINGKEVRVQTDANSIISDVPDFVGGYRDLDIPTTTKDWSITNYDVPTFVQSRQLILKVKFEGNNVPFINSFSGIISGITVSRDLNKAFANNATSDHPALESGLVKYALTDLDSEGYQTDTHRLLGVAGNGSQTLALTVNYNGGLQKAFTFDVTKSLDGFHTKDVMTPWVIKILIHLGADFQAEIVDWQEGPITNLEAH